MRVSPAQSYRPAQRWVSVDVLTTAGWARGTLVLPQIQALLDFIAGAGAFLKLVNAQLPQLVEPQSYMALKCESVLLIAPAVGNEKVEIDAPGASMAPLNVVCLLEDGVLEGTLNFLVNLRLSDFLRHQTGFLVVRDATWTAAPRTGQPPAAPRKFPVTLVNASRIVAITEVRDGTDPDHPGELPEVRPMA